MLHDLAFDLVWLSVFVAGVLTGVAIGLGLWFLFG